MLRVESDINPLQNIRELYLFLKKYQLIAREKQQLLIISLSQKIQPVEPLAILKIFEQDKRPHFYLEKKANREFILAIDTVIKREIQGQNRFAETQTFIDSCLSKNIVAGDINLPFTGLHFCCGFSFFANNYYTQDEFPDATVFIPEIQLTRFQQDFLLTVNLLIDLNTDLHKLTNRINKQVQKILNVGNFQPNHRTSINNHYSAQLNIEKIEKLQTAVQLALQVIKTQNLTKLVVAHSIDTNLPADFQLTRTLNCLRHSYPACHTFSLSNGNGLNFIGASPERLLKIKNYQLTTDTLAGSAPRGRTAIQDRYLAEYLLNNSKEIAEHQLVREFIKQQLIKLKLTPVYSEFPQILRLANIQHLWTPIKAKLTDRIHALDLVDSLHPTPAVAGIPQNIACQKIRSYENFERNLYASPLGWIDYQGNSEFVVGIRSALIYKNSARLYAGAGIVAESNIKMEIEEIKLKFQPILSTL